MVLLEFKKFMTHIYETYPNIERPFQGYSGHMGQTPCEIVKQYTPLVINCNNSKYWFAILDIGQSEQEKIAAAESEHYSECRFERDPLQPLIYINNV